MFGTLALSSLLIFMFDLDSVHSNELDLSLKAVGYIVLILLSLYVGIFTLTTG